MVKSERRKVSAENRRCDATWVDSCVSLADEPGSPVRRYVATNQQTTIYSVSERFCGCAAVAEFRVVGRHNILWTWNN